MHTHPISVLHYIAHILHALSRLLGKTLNPLDDSIDADDHVLLAEAAQELREDQGLADYAMVVHRGFITRGEPLRFLQALAHRMHETSATAAGRRRRRLEAMDGEL